MALALNNLKRVDMPLNKETKKRQNESIWILEAWKSGLHIHYSVALCGWAAKADDSFVCFDAKPDKGFLDMKSRRIRKWRRDANESWLDKGAESSWRWTAERQLTGDPDESSWRWTAERQLAAGQQGELAWNHGQGQSTLDSGDIRRQDGVQRRRLSQKMSAFQCLGNFR